MNKFPTFSDCLVPGIPWIHTDLYTAPNNICMPSSNNVPNGLNDLGRVGTKEFRKVANKGPFEGNDTHPLILRDVNSNWDNYINEKLIGGTAGDILSGALGLVGLLTRTSRDLADKARVFNFLISPKIFLSFSQEHCCAIVQ